MRKILFFLIVFLSVINLSFAHAPKKIEYEYVGFESKLKLSVVHIVGNFKKHFIRKVEISRNGKLVDTQYFTKQTNNTALELSIDLEAEAGDRIKVKAYCNEGGVLESLFVIKKIDFEQLGSDPENGKRKTENGKRKTENGKRKTENGKQNS